MSDIKVINNKKYIELDSTYRNRNLYPFQAQFKINVKNTGIRNTAETAYDPVTDGISRFIWKSRNNVAFTMEGVPSAPLLNLPPTTTVYKGQFILNNDTGETSLITFFSDFSDTAFLETSFGNSWAVGQDGFVVTPSVDEFVFLFSRNTTFDNQFVGDLLYNITQQEYRTITAYDSTFQILTLESDIPTATITDEYMIVKDTAFNVGTIDFFANPTYITDNTATLIGASSVDDIYVGKYITLIQFNGPDILVTFSRLITSYDGTTNVATFTPAIDSSQFIAADVEYMITNFTKDTSSFLTTFFDNKNTTSLYRISLNNLVLPNTTLDHPNGGTITNFPYVYVVFSNNSAGTQSLINSNNPNVKSATFRCAVNDVDNAEISTFVKLRSEMVNTILFNPNDELTFEVYLPDGTLFKTLTSDNDSPLNPNPLLQISCAVSFEYIPFSESELVTDINFSQIE